MRAAIVGLTALILAALPMVHAGPGDEVRPAPKEGIEEPTKKVKELQKERIATLKELVGVATTMYQKGRGSYEAVVEATMQLLKAEVDAAEKESDRIALYQQAVDLLKQVEKLAQTRAVAGRATSIEGLGIKARRLEVEIQLERAKAKEAKAGK